MDNVGSLVLAAALGASFSGLVTLAVQNRLAGQRRNEQEQRAAYVRLVQVTELTTGVDVAKSMTRKVMAGLEKQESGLDRLFPSDGSYTAEHAIAAALAALVKEKLGDGKPKPELAMLKNGTLQSTLDLLNFSMPPSELSDLPRGTISAYSFFSTYATHTRLALQFTLESLAEGQISSLTAEYFLLILQNVRWMMEHAEKLRSALVVHCELTDAEAAALHKTHLDKHWASLSAQLEAQPKLAAAKKAFEATAPT